MDDNNNFLDKNTILAIALSILFFVGWQYYVSKKYPEAYQQDKIVEKVEEKNQSKQQGTQSAQTQLSETNNSEVQSAQEFAAAQNTPETSFDIDFENYSTRISSKGMSLSLVELKQYTDREDKNIVFEDSETKIGNFATLFNGKILNFNIEKKSDKHFVGTAQAGAQTIIKEFVFIPETYSVNVSIKTLNGRPNQSDLIETQIASKVLKIESSMFTPAYEGTEYFVINDGSEERERIDIEAKMAETFDKATLTSIGSLYFTVALKDESDVIPKARFNYFPDKEVAHASVFHQASTTSGLTSIQFTGFIGPKKYDILKTLQPEMAQMINFGMFSVLSKPILSMLKWLFGMFKNWGLAIILLTICIRIILLPINISSLKSMKKMQKIQPQLKAIKEKYKDDPQRVNQETMALMKKEKANPLGGCLPMFLQIPVFFALYSVIGQSVELYKQPFAFWIRDLSYQDPFFVLPISVGALYFVQMSMTPQTGMDPTQAKMMKFIPILFCFFMITVPSGLTLYFFVNTIFGIGQQFIFQRERRKAAA